MFALLLCVTLGMAAQTSVKGIVQDKSGEPLIGATVQEKGNTANGIATGIDGDFTIRVKSPKAVLLVSYVGMKPQEVALNGRTDVTVTLEDDSEVLDEVVVVGYGTMKKSDLAGASASLNEDALKGGNHQYGPGSPGPRHRRCLDGLVGCPGCRIVHTRAWPGHHQRQRRASLRH